MSAFRWLAGGDWADADLTGVVVGNGAITLAPGGAGGGRHGTAVLAAGRPAAGQVSSSTSDRWRRVAVRLAEPLPERAWLRVWTRVATTPAIPGPPDPAVDLADDAPVDTAPDRWRAAAVDALDARVLCRAAGRLWVAVELGGLAGASARVDDILVESGDEGPVTLLPAVYRGAATADPLDEHEVDDGDGMLGRYLGLLGAQLAITSSLLGELPADLSPAVAPDRDDAPWLERLADWVAVHPDDLPGRGGDEELARREVVLTAPAHHAVRGTREGLRTGISRSTGIALERIEIEEPLLSTELWRLDGTAVTSALGMTTGLVLADPGPPALDRNAYLDASMLIAPEEAGLPVHARVAHRICVHVVDGTPDQLAAVDEYVQRERPAHVLARTCTVSRTTDVDAVVGIDRLPGPGPAGLADDVSFSPALDGPGLRIGSARLPADSPDSVSRTRHPFEGDLP